MLHSTSNLMHPQYLNNTPFNREGANSVMSSMQKQNHPPEYQFRASDQATHMSRVQCTRPNNRHLIDDSNIGSSFMIPQEMHRTISAVEHRHGSHPLSSDSVNNTNGSSQEDTSNNAEQISNSFLLADMPFFNHAYLEVQSFLSKKQLCTPWVEVVASIILKGNLNFISSCVP
ncbi:hypothetical protein GUJ93_ZPchr0001g30477 [Zizania palustris]|uniref:Uncharacterized protein n=1 Tax=Zizania palustris TaxID=103762 RepID=A0A8J5REF7_ZIZPA|nr:hypothetical protein GUJ93_ZPchr0001g30477 [Zizania palustris]